MLRNSPGILEKTKAFCISVNIFLISYNIIMRYGFGFNTDLFETNVLNLAVVVGVVVTVVGDAFRDLLDKRQKNILMTLQEADQKAREALELLREARNSVDKARIRAQEICTQSKESAEREGYSIQAQLKEDLQRITERSYQAIQLEYQRRVQSVVQQVSNLALTAAESKLVTALSNKGPSRQKQKVLNEIHVNDTFFRLKSS